MVHSRRWLTRLAFFYFALSLGIWFGWQFETDRRMRRDLDAAEQELRSTGMSAWQTYQIRYGMSQAYTHATSYASMVLIVVIMCSQGMMTALISSLPEHKSSPGASTASGGS